MSTEGKDGMTEKGRG